MHLLSSNLLLSTNNHITKIYLPLWQYLLGYKLLSMWWITYNVFLNIVKSDYQQWRMTVVFQKWGDGFLYDSVYLGVLFHDGRLCLVCNAGLCLVPNLPSPRNSEGWSQKQNVLLPHCQLVCATGVDHCLSVCIRGRLLLWHCKDVYHTLCFVIKSVFERKNMHQLSFNDICINLFMKELNYLI